MVQYNADYQGDYVSGGSHIKDVAGAESNVAVNIHKLLPKEVESLWNFLSHAVSARAE